MTMLFYCTITWLCRIIMYDDCHWNKSWEITLRLIGMDLAYPVDADTH